VASAGESEFESVVARQYVSFLWTACSALAASAASIAECLQRQLIHSRAKMMGSGCRWGIKVMLWQQLA
jgi:hypothetical protein